LNRTDEVAYRRGIVADRRRWSCAERPVMPSVLAPTRVLALLCGCLAGIAVVVAQEAVTQEAPPMDCDSLAASADDPQRKAPGVPLDAISPKKAIAACFKAKTLFSGEARFRYQLGRAYEASKEPDIARRWYGEAAERGHAPAQARLGRFYEDGDGVPQDDGEAARWFRKAAEQGDPAAQTKLGNMYAGGRGVDEDIRAAMTWFRRAADQGFAPAQYTLAVALEDGEGVDKDEAQALALYRKAAAQGYAPAKERLEGR
jgi:TPR repeat protein